MAKRPRVDRALAIRTYVGTLTPEQRKDHFTRMKFPSGHGRRGGANRSSTLRREVRLKTTIIEFCPVCAGALNTDAVIFDHCSCSEGSL